MSSNIIELKGPDAPLDKKQKRSGKDYGTPVEQAFSYTGKYDKCKWYIVSNMNEIRLYQVGRSQEHYELFYIQDLDQEEEFKRFHFLLCKDNLINREDKSLTLKLTERTKEHVEDISVAFYNLYKNTRIDLFERLKANHPDIDEELLLEKAQKFLDRIIFICFCEDLGLLPNDLLHEAIKQGKQSFGTVWDQVKYVFRYVNKGKKEYDINAYNGGLFEQDDLLEALKIKDDFFEVIYKISSYNFDSDMDVNILGHIFEQSISDIEELKSDIQQDEYDASKSRRKKEGIYYTPQYITRYIVENALGKYLEDIREELGEESLPNIESAPTPQVAGRYRNQHLEFYHKYEQRLNEVKVLDPACGSGAFLNQAFDYLYQEREWINEQVSRLQGGQTKMYVFEDTFQDRDTYQRNILQNNLYGVDLNEESVEITKLSLWLKTANKNKPLAYLDDNIKCGNSLIDDPDVAGEKAFDWEEEFLEIMGDGGFDVVIGNPPYVRQEQLHIMKDYFSCVYEAYNNTADIYCYFFERGLELLKRNGYFSFIVSSKFTRTKYGKKLRKLLIKYQIIDYVDYKDEVVFKDATVDPCTIVIRKKKPSKDNKIRYNKAYEVYQDNLNINTWSFITKEKSALMGKIKGNGICLKEWNVNIYRGILTGLNEAFIIDEDTKDNFISKDKKNKEIIKPILRGRDIKRYSCEFNNIYLLATGFDINIPEEYPIIYEHLIRYKNKAKNRTDKGENWWNLRQCSYYNEFEKDKLLWPELSDKARFVIDENIHFYPLKTVFCLTGDDLKYLISILNSSLSEWYFDKISTSTGVGTNMWSKYKVEQLPIPINSHKENLIINADLLLKLKEQEKNLCKLTFIDFAEKFSSIKGLSISQLERKSDFFNPIYSGRARKLRNLTVTTNDTILTIYAEKSGNSKYELMKFEVKDRYQRDYLKLYLENLTEDQLEEINDKYSGNILKKVLQIEVPDYDKYNVVRKVVTEWRQHQRDIERLESQIEQIDREIDEMVYELYGLTDEEIRIVEENLEH